MGGEGGAQFDLFIFFHKKTPFHFFITIPNWLIFQQPIPGPFFNVCTTIVQQLYIVDTLSSMHVRCEYVHCTSLLISNWKNLPLVLVTYIPSSDLWLCKSVPIPTHTEYWETSDSAYYLCILLYMQVQWFASSNASRWNISWHICMKVNKLAMRNWILVSHFNHL